MKQDILLRIVLGAVLLSVIGIRIYYMRSMRLPSKDQTKKSAAKIVVPLLAMLCGISLIGIALASPSWMAWSCLPLPLWLRWCGVVLGAIAALLLRWVHHTLGRNFSPQVRIRQQHALCTSGPYGRVRHPMYAILFMLSISWLIGLANWLLGLFWLTIQTIIIATRIRKEEAVLIEHFGDEYRAYMLKTGRFLPRLRQPGKAL